jgi:hypothetical protein
MSEQKTKFDAFTEDELDLVAYLLAGPQKKNYREVAKSLLHQARVEHFIQKGMEPSKAFQVVSEMDDRRDEKRKTNGPE